MILFSDMHIYLEGWGDSISNAVEYKQSTNTVLEAVVSLPNQADFRNVTFLWSVQE